MSPSSKAWRICDKLTSAPERARESFRLTTEKMVSFFARGPYCFPWKSPVHLIATDRSSGEAAAKVRRDDATRALRRWRM